MKLATLDIDITEFDRSQAFFTHNDKAYFIKYTSWEILSLIGSIEYSYDSGYGNFEYHSGYNRNPEWDDVNKSVIAEFIFRNSNRWEPDNE